MNIKSYADLAKDVYSTGQKEGWTTQHLFQMLTNPQKFEKMKENVKILHSFLQRFPEK